jgi:hypothetical protein
VGRRVARLRERLASEQCVQSLNLLSLRYHFREIIVIFSTSADSLVKGDVAWIVPKSIFIHKST